MTVAESLACALLARAVSRYGVKPGVNGALRRKEHTTDCMRKGGIVQEMAKKRMFTIDIVDSDAFLDMPISAQALYFHLNMRADDDGFVGNPKKIMRAVGTSEDDLKVLIAKRFLITFDNGVIVIKHWRMHNTLSAIRYHETSYVSEKDMLKIKRNGAYTLDDGEPLDDSKLVEIASRQTKDEQKTNKRQTKDEQKTNADIDIDLGLDIDKDLDKDKGLDKEREIKTKKPQRSRFGEYHHVLLTEEDHDKLIEQMGESKTSEYVKKVDEYCQQTGKTYKDYYLTILNWWRKDGDGKKVETDRERMERWLREGGKGN